MDKVVEKLSEAFLLIIPLSLGYFSGVIYLSEYLKAFSINIHEIDVGLQLAITYAFPVFYNIRFGLVLIATVLAVTFLYGPWQASIKFNEELGKVLAIRANVVIVTLVGCFAAFAVINICAQAAAREVSSQIWKGQASRVWFNSLPSTWDVSLGVRQALIYRKCVDRSAFYDIISTPNVTYGLCVLEDGEGLVIGQRHEDGRILPMRSVRNESH
ncbi:hypothetical protein [Rhizobium leguminosarum]|uniref:hypothetical protein n=1 Tax=Rhizobium leguminosarum TaxID=384 RepID=UPI003F94E28C